MAYARMLEFADDTEELTAAERSSLESLLKRYQSAVVSTRSGGLFTVWAGAAKYSPASAH
jgi:hypothetical protein